MKNEISQFLKGPLSLSSSETWCWMIIKVRIGISNVLPLFCFRNRSATDWCGCILHNPWSPYAIRSRTTCYRQCTSSHKSFYSHTHSPQQLLFLSGVTLVIGVNKTFRFFFQKRKLRFCLPTKFCIDCFIEEHLVSLEVYYWC